MRSSSVLLFQCLSPTRQTSTWKKNDDQRQVVCCLGLALLAVTRSPSDVWVAQQLREATPFGEQPRCLIRDNDRKFGEHFANVAAEIEILCIPVHAPRANAFCERFMGGLRRECLDHILILSEKQLRRIVNEYVISSMKTVLIRAFTRVFPPGWNQHCRLRAKSWRVRSLMGFTMPIVARLPE